MSRRSTWLQRLAPLWALLLVCAGCRAPPGARTPLDAAAGPPGATGYQLDAAASQLTLLVRADGPLARLGHSHVISTRALQGVVWVHRQLERSACAVSIPVASFSVDDPQERAAAGGEFAPPLDEDARAGTREHMLGASQLDAAAYPLVALRCSRVSATADGVLLEMAVTLRGHEATLSVPAHWDLQGGTLRASGEFRFRQSELGMEPYSALLGALRVADELQARFSIVARQP